MIAGQGEVRTDNKAISAAVERGDSSILCDRKESGGVNRHQARVLSKRKGRPRGSGKQSPGSSCTGSTTSSTASPDGMKTNQKRSRYEKYGSRS